MRGSVCAGLGVESARDFGRRRGLRPYVSCISLPLLPTIMTPPSLFTSSFSPSSSGLGGRRPPSYHVRLTAGILPRAGNLKKVCVALGKETLLNGVQTVSMLVGRP